jgi:hypothetical protein
MTPYQDDDDDDDDDDERDVIKQIAAYQKAVKKRVLLSLGRLKLGAWYDIDFAAHRLPVCVIAINSRNRVLVECPFWRVKDSV